MKGSDKWGEKGGPRVELVLLALVVVFSVGAYLFYAETSGLVSGAARGDITTVSTTGIACGSPLMPDVARTAEQSPQFASLSDGLCYNYMGGSSKVQTFAHYNGTISYPCGDAPVEAPASEIDVALNSSGGVVSASQVKPAELQAPPCDRSLDVGIVSLGDVESTIPAIPQLNLTLAVPDGGRPVSGLVAVLTLHGGSQTFRFGTVAPKNPLRPGTSASSTEIVLSSLSFAPDDVYPLTISGTLIGGGSFDYVVQAQVSGVP